MSHPNIYKLSRRYGPPSMDIRAAHIMDMYGDDSLAMRSIKHVVPEDVTRADLDFYPEDFCYMPFEDLLFYMYPVALEYDRDCRLSCVNSYMYSLNRFVPASSSQLTAPDRQALIEGLRWMWLAAPLGYADWVQCPNLQQAIGVSVKWDDVHKAR